ncbi:hypothetical protein [Clostridium botulinum]|uniref:Uncharacterized protein n=1 Tax=Clostridium botulinum (strain Kyoto / Type A2) TaxID=536232 RepID=C1FM99_CLOBJ|nr:hypothetical protein [Clostridium botulinum]ACO87078.1 hypothetical protein CLM_1644 [Clostridium botulinum A2 str. Kyoto]APH22693.1 hypothetical protein NPD1_431 [Clostridium botulinum]APQ68857.1 hypothetical protein RSJ8_2633 [Clostridium botulinum]MBN3376153.1 hypothetical protein [Clostridium botulinum]MBN3380916.1 hypothetical protein [Clostridium botulinum]
MMKATPKFDKESDKWVIDIETEDGEVIPVGHTIEESIGLFEICKWDSEEQAEEWIKARSEKFYI